MSVANYSQKTENEKHEMGTLNQTKCINQSSLKEGLVLLLTGVNKQYSSSRMLIHICRYVEKCQYKFCTFSN